MQDTDKKQNNFLKKLKELDLKIDIEKEKVKHNNLIKEEFENINASYNRCLDILSRSATGKNINPKYNELYLNKELLFSNLQINDDLSLLSGSQGQVYRTLVDFVNCIYQNLEVGDKYKEIINTIKYFHAGYVKYPTKMLHNVAILLNLYMTKMYELCTDDDVKSDIMSVKKYFLSDMDDFKCEILNNGDITDEAYRNLLTLWDILPRMDMRRNERLGRTNIDSNETLEVELPDYEEPVVESKVSTGTKSSELIKALTESFEVLKDGTIKVTIPKKSTYMDEYAENHRLLVANHKAKNYEGMKYNLVYHLILIDSIEKNVLYNTKVKKDSPLYEDAVKARSFAKNDISTYLPEVRQHVKEFDINHFYKEVRAEQSMITINGVETAQGVKKIIKSILL